MRYISEKELDQEIKNPTVKDCNMGTIEKFIPNYQLDIMATSRIFGKSLEPYRLMSTKFVNLDTNFIDPFKKP
jgi:hypothetical protein